MRGCLCTLFGTESRTSQMARPNPLDLTVCPTPDVMAFPLTIVPKLRTCIPHTKRFEDRAHARSSNRFVCGIQIIQGPVSLTIGDQNAIKSCRWNSDFYLSAVLNRATPLFSKYFLGAEQTRSLFLFCGNQVTVAPGQGWCGLVEAQGIAIRRAVPA